MEEETIPMLAVSRNNDSQLEAAINKTSSLATSVSAKQGFECNTNAKPADLIDISVANRTAETQAVAAASLSKSPPDQMAISSDSVSVGQYHTSSRQKHEHRPYFSKTPASSFNTTFYPACNPDGKLSTGYFRYFTSIPIVNTEPSYSEVTRFLTAQGLL